MSKVSADTLKSLDPTQDLTIGTTGQTVTLPGNELRVNTFKDKGGNTLWTSDGAGNLSSVNSAFEGNLKLIQEQTASNSASISFTTGIDSTYDVYIFKFIDINPDAVSHFSFQGNASGQTGFNEIITSVYYKAYHDEGNSAYALALDTGPEQNQGTAYQALCQDTGHDADQALVGELYLYAPSSTTYAKHFLAETQYSHGSDYSQNHFIGGYFNVTAAITEISFKCSTGNFDGIVKMYGLS